MQLSMCISHNLEIRSWESISDKLAQGHLEALMMFIAVVLVE